MVFEVEDLPKESCNSKLSMSRNLLIDRPWDYTRDEKAFWSCFRVKNQAWGAMHGHIVKLRS